MNLATPGSQEPDYIQYFPPSSLHVKIIFPKKKFIWCEEQDTLILLLKPSYDHWVSTALHPSMLRREKIVKIFTWVKEAKNLHLSLDSARISTLLACKTSWWCFQASKRPWSQIFEYGFIQKGRTSVLINEKGETYRLNSKGKQEWAWLMEKVKGKDTPPRHEETKRGCLWVQWTMGEDKKPHFLEMRRQIGFKNDEHRLGRTKAHTF